MITTNSLDASYTADGTLLSSRENLKNFRLDRPILVSLQNTQYKDWSINKTFHVIKSSSKGIEKERYGIVMKKGKEKRTIMLDPNGQNMLQYLFLVFHFEEYLF